MSTHRHMHAHIHTNRVSWEFKAIVLCTGAIRDSDVKWGQAADLNVFMSSVGTPPNGPMPKSDQSQLPILATVVDGDVLARHCGNSNLCAAGLCLSIRDRLRTGLI